MSGFLGIDLGSVLKVAQIFMGPAGILGALAQEVLGQIIQQAIQKVGQQLGLPQKVIDMAKSAFAQASGTGGSGSLGQALQNLGTASGASPMEVGKAARQADDIASKMADQMLRQLRGGGDEDGSVGGGSNSRLVALAKALGKLLDKKMDRIIEVGKQMDGAEKQGALSGEMNALSQEMGMISNALNNMVKSIGEANTTLARKS